MKDKFIVSYSKERKYYLAYYLDDCLLALSENELQQIAKALNEKNIVICQD